MLNEKIKAQEVMLIGNEGENFGIIPTKKALE
ncbi:translation initiation factor IF-3, partial [bacterium]|nr:translation initiation factor IF-3 [bacterium]